MNYMKIDNLANFQTTFVDPIKETFEGMVHSIINGLPQVIVAVVIMIVGYFIASILRKFISTLLSKVKFDELLDKAGVGSIFRKIGVKGSASELLGKVVFWIVILFVVKSAADKLGIDDVSAIINKIMDFLPKVFVSGIIMLVGFMVADIIRNAVYGTLDALGLEYAGALAKIIFGFIFIIVLTVALSQLGIETELLIASVQIILASLGLGLALCLGFGLKKLANQVVSGVYARDLFKVGTVIEYQGEEVKVAGVGPVTTKLMRNDGGFIMVPNDELTSSPVRGRSAE